MRKLVHVVAAILSVVSMFPGIVRGEEGDPTVPRPGGGTDNVVVARVNGVGIPSAAVETMMASLYPETGVEPESPAIVKERRKEALEHLIFLELAYQRARAEGLSPTPEEVDRAVSSLRKRRGDGEKWKEYLQHGGITEEELRIRVERNLAIQRVLKREVRDKAPVSEQDVREMYEKERERYTRPEKTVVTDVLFFLDPGEASSRKQAEEVLQRIQEDPEKNPWSVASDGTFYVRDLEVREDRERGLYEEAKRLSLGELSGVFDYGGNLHVIRLKEYVPYRQFPFEEVRGRVEMEASAQARKKRLSEWEAELRSGARIEVVE